MEDESARGGRKKRDKKSGKKDASAMRVAVSQNGKREKRQEGDSRFCEFVK